MKNIKQYGYNLGRNIHDKTTSESLIEEMIRRRMNNTGETRRQTIDHIVEYLKGSH